MSSHILVTGSSGLIGSALVQRLRAEGHKVREFDLRAIGSARGDMLCEADVARAVEGVEGVVHLAAVSRVVWAQNDPKHCWDVNVEALRTLLAHVTAAPRKPWVVFGSSREVYGEPQHFPVMEDAPLVPLNVYGRAKVEGEMLVRDVGEAGGRASILRFSNVFGSVRDHADRVVPAFVRAAIRGEELRVDGRDNTFDFTHVDDVVRGAAAVINLMISGTPALSPIHFVTGQPTTLHQLATMVIAEANSASRIREAAERSYDVARFHGSYERARQELGWTPEVDVRSGVRRLMQDMRASMNAAG